MTALLYYFYSSNLSEEKKLAINKEISGNRVTVIKFIKKLYAKGKVIVISTTVAIVIIFSTPDTATAIGTSVPPPVPIVRVRHSTEIVPSYARLGVEKPDKII